MKYNEKTIKMVSEILEDAKNVKLEKFSPIICQAIVYAVSKKAPIELKQKAWLLVYNALETRINSWIKCFDSERHEDYLNECFIVIMENLSKWNPNKGDLESFFKLPIIKACKVLQLSEQTFDSIYYKDIYNEILKTVNELTEKGIATPTEKQIHMALQNKGSRHSLKTIHYTFEQVNRKLVSIEMLNEEECDSNSTDFDMCNSHHDFVDSSSDPIHQVLKKEREEEFLQCINALMPNQKVIMEIELRLAQEPCMGKREFNDYIMTEYRNRVDSNTESIRVIRTVAERAFLHKYHNLMLA